MTDYTLRRDGSALYLTAGRERLLLREGYRWPTVAGPFSLTLAGGATISPDAYSPTILRVRLGGKTVRLKLDDVTSPWFDDDGLWGGPAPAAAVRDFRKRVGLSAAISNLTAGGDALGVVTWRAVRGSGDPVRAQMLVRIEPSLEPKLEPLRPLDLPENGEWSYGFSSFPCQRLLAAGPRRLLLLHPGAPQGTAAQRAAELVQIDPTGKTLRRFASLPGTHYPIGVAGDRWLVLLATEQNAGHRLWLLDLERRQERPLPGDWSGVLFPDYLGVATDSAALLALRVGKGGLSTSYAVSLPSGRRVALPNPSGSVEQRLWNGRAILVNSPEGKVSIYSAASGRLLRRLPIPPG